ncbi:hypothetical protein [Paenibacillus glucanolyticus]|uniref:hypothetical protein n=1 Tax=Paenibacillus glucanolyticus TaxID=59843 RepID=UPI00096EC688|nr:hypothetical protein [Paenibacillus glucanolyticus]OMF81751.1 hypothetical protein BK142_04580 [Paenibacillus glucanolyticus]
MAILLPEQIFSLAPSVGKSFYEHQAGVDASVTISNFSDEPISLVITRVGAPALTYVIEAHDQRVFSIELLQMAALLTGSSAAYGTIVVATTK